MIQLTSRLVPFLSSFSVKKSVTGAEEGGGRERTAGRHGDIPQSA